MPSPHTADLAAAIERGERNAVADALNLLDDRRDEARERASALLTALQDCLRQKRGHLVGITGPPGAGKSTLIAALTGVWRQRGMRVGVLAVDPSSPLSGGALLGDRLRMQTGTEDDGVFVRSLSDRGHFGGLSAEVWPMSIVMLAAFDIVVIETVGVGQREIDVSRMCDTTCYVAQPGSGDSVQALKAGILEVPHILVVNKSDMGVVAQRLLGELGSALDREHPDGQWQVTTLPTSATGHDGIDALADELERHFTALQSHQQLEPRHRAYQAYWISRQLLNEFGSYGVSLLGGESTLTEQIKNSQSSLFQQYDALRQQLLARLGSQGE